MTAMTFALGGVAFFMPRYLQVERHLDPAKATPIFGGIVVVAGLLATLAGGMAGDALRKKFSGSYFLVSAGGMLLGFPLFLGILFTPFPACWVVMFAAVFCLFFNTGPSNTILANVTQSSVRATAFALNIFIIHAFGDAISPPVIGWINDHYSMRTAFMVMSLTMLIGGVLWLMGSKYLEADTARASNPPASNRGFEVIPTPAE
jgi:MFS family permease